MATTEEVAEFMKQFMGRGLHLEGLIEHEGKKTRSTPKKTSTCSSPTTTST